MKNKEIWNLLCDLMVEIGKKMIKDYDTIKDDLLASYNFYQEEERDGRGYIFDIENKEDVMGTDLTMREINDIYNEYKENKTKYFIIDEHGYIKLYDYDELKSQIVSYLDEIIEHIFCYHDSCESHKKLFDRYIYETIISNKD